MTYATQQASLAIKGSLNFLSILKAGIVTGIIAGTALGGLLLLFLTPLILEAENYEVLIPDSHPLIPRNIVHFWTFAGAIVLGILYSVIFTFVYTMVQHSIPVKNTQFKGLILALNGFLVAVFVPSLYLPPNPPGIETSLPVMTRQSIFFAIIIAGILASIAFWVIYSRLSRKYNPMSGFSIGAFVFVAMIATAFLLVPSNSNIPSIPSDLLWKYRVESLGAMFAFWAVMGMMVNGMLDYFRLHVKSVLHL
ncbi:MAG TPA: CbtA family protein [candidate division Zixibacteria bacterium]|nr:CbtA family protein [candidate division Zixibacteria bacterium]